MDLVSGEIPPRKWRLSVGAHLDGCAAHPACVHDDFVVRVGQVSDDGLPETHVGEICEANFGGRVRSSHTLGCRECQPVQASPLLHSPFALSRSSTSCAAVDRASQTTDRKSQRTADAPSRGLPTRGTGPRG